MCGVLWPEGERGSKRLSVLEVCARPRAAAPRREPMTPLTLAVTLTVLATLLPRGAPLPAAVVRAPPRAHAAAAVRTPPQRAAPPPGAAAARRRWPKPPLRTRPPARRERTTGGGAGVPGRAGLRPPRQAALWLHPVGRAAPPGRGARGQRPAAARGDAQAHQRCAPLAARPLGRSAAARSRGNAHRLRLRLRRHAGCRRGGVSSSSSSSAPLPSSPALQPAAARPNCPLNPPRHNPIKKSRPELHAGHRRRLHHLRPGRPHGAGLGARAAQQQRGRSSRERTPGRAERARAAAAAAAAARGSDTLLPP